MVYERKSKTNLILILILPHETYIYVSDRGVGGGERGVGNIFYRLFCLTYVFSFCFYNPRNRIADERPASYPIRNVPHTV